VALHCDVAPAAIVDGAQAGETDEMDDAGDMEADWLPPPQAVSPRRSDDTTKSRTSGHFMDLSSN
jgi:hypothetical protein